MKMTSVVTPVMVGKFWEAEVVILIDGEEAKRYITDEGASSPKQAVEWGEDDVNDWYLYYEGGVEWVKAG